MVMLDRNMASPNLIPRINVLSVTSKGKLLPKYRASVKILGGTVSTIMKPTMTVFFQFVNGVAY